MSKKTLFLHYDKKKNIKEKVDQADYLGMSQVSRLELFLLAMAIGKKSPTEVQNKDSLVRGEYVHKDLDALPFIISLSIGSNQKEEDIDDLLNDENLFSYAEQCANTGFQVIEDEIEHYNPDDTELEKIIELNDIYEKNVKQ